MSSDIAQQIWDMKYRFKEPDGTPVDRVLDDTFSRVAHALTAAEEDSATWEARFVEVLRDLHFIPAGRVLAGAGTGRRVTLFNCFVMGKIPDDMAGIFTSLTEAALTMQQGGGIGHDFSTLRPKGAPVRGVGADASGPLSFMDVWDAMCRTIMSAGSRRGAMMATLRCDHPDIEEFVDAKRDPERLRMFNLSVLATDRFMAAVRENRPWDLVFDGSVYKTLAARDLWDRIMRATYDAAEPGVIFIDRINALNNLHYCEEIQSTNPCGEQPLPPYGACLLGSVNLARLIRNPFTDAAHLDLEALERVVPVAVRMLDNVIDVSTFPLEQQEKEARLKRRIGLGVTGLADALALCRVRYGSAAGLELTHAWLTAFRRAAYVASVELAREKGPFPLFDRERFGAGAFVRTLEPDVQDAIRSHGIRNALVTSIAPTGTISLFAQNVSSGIEPIFAYGFSRRILQPDGSRREEQVTDYAVGLFRSIYGEDAELPEYFVDVQRLSPAEHVSMQAAAQRYVDSSISKTINLPAGISFEAFKDVYALAYDSGCKGCTTYRPNAITGAVLSAEPAEPPSDGGAEIVHITQPLSRPAALPGATYKLKWADSEHAIYVTVNDILQDGRRRPFEVFINSKNMEHYAWTVALTRMISAVFRRGGDVTFVVEELKAVFDPRGGHWMDGRYVPSLLAAIGDVIEQHMVQIGFLTPVASPRAGSLPSTGRAGVNTGGFGQCPRCGQAGLVRQEGCDLCTSCGYSKCA